MAYKVFEKINASMIKNISKKMRSTKPCHESVFMLAAVMHLWNYIEISDRYDEMGIDIFLTGFYPSKLKYGHRDLPTWLSMMASNGEHQNERKMRKESPEELFDIVVNKIHNILEVSDI